MIDYVPRTLSKKNYQLLEGLAREIESQLEIRRISRASQKLVEERAILTDMILHDTRGALGVLDLSFGLFKEEIGTDVKWLDQFQGSVDVLEQLCKGFADVNETQSRGLKVSM